MHSDGTDIALQNKRNEKNKLKILVIVSVKNLWHSTKIVNWILYKAVLNSPVSGL
jgi:hypothetical protein